MASKVPAVLIASGLGITALGGFLWWYQHHVEKQAQAAAAAKAQAQPQSKIPLTVFADEGVPLEATPPRSNATGNA